MTSNNRFKTMPQVRAWLPLSVFSLILTLIAGLVGSNANLLKSEFSIDASMNSNGNGLLNSIANLFSTVYSPKGALILTLVVMVLIWLVGKSRLDAVGFGLTVAFGWLPAEVFKLAFKEPRGDISGFVNKVTAQEVDASFPSGHVCFAIAFGFAVWYLSRRTRLRNVVLVLWPVSVIIEGWARLYVGAHYLNDEVGSVFTATLGILIFGFLWNKWISPKLLSLKFFA